MTSEKEKMLAAKPYLSNDAVLVNERLEAKKLLFKLNNIEPSELEEKRNIFLKLLGKTGQNFNIELPFRCDYGYNISLGENFYSNYNLLILDCAPVVIGNNAIIAPNVSIFTAGHPIHSEPRNQQLEYALPVIIGDNVWLGGNTVINPGVRIGENTVIGAGSIVTRDIPANVVAVGNPCRVLREITPADKDCYFRELRF